MTSKNLDLHYEQALLERLIKDESAAYKKNYADTFPMVCAYIKNNTGTAEDARDAMAESFVALLKMVAKPGFTLTCRVSVLLFSICRFWWLKELRRRKNTQKLEEKTSGFETVELPDMDILSGETSTDPRADCAQKSLDAIGEACQQIILWAYYEEKSHQEIAETLHTSPGYCAVKLHRCMERLRKMAEACIQKI